ncbi:MAG: hemolysin III family protein [Deltaproteobacteria bacterium]|nr:MAG: hemolysin III family protein [Deltaproteobacteria bacterium]
MYHGEKLNSITHLVGTTLALIGFGALLTVSVQQEDPWMIASFVVFGGSLVLLYTSSTLYHSISNARAKRVFQKLDHVAIYLLIAGTYTPFMLVSLRDARGPQMFALVWGLAAVGIALDLFVKKRIEALQIVIYLAMGWVAVLDFSSLTAAITAAGTTWLAAGGAAYTFGVIFYVMDKKTRFNHAHGVWHIFVLAGSISHFISVFGYVR